MKKLAVSIVTFLMLVSCGQKDQPVVEKISQLSPYTIEVKRERSYFQAEKINARLQDKGLQSYIMSVEDSTGGGQWYTVVVGALADSVIADSIKNDLQHEFRLDSLTVLNYLDSSKVFIDPDSLVIPERKQISAQKPALPDEIFDVIEKFPNSNMFFVQDIKVVNCKQNKRKASVTDNLYGLDLPRGITVSHILEYADAWAETIYKDNIYGDQVTIDILKLKKDHNLAQRVIQSSMLPSTGDDYQLKIAEHFADLILETDDYTREEKEDMDEEAYNVLKGYKVVIETNSGDERTYLVLVDQSGEFVFFCQSTEKSLDDLRAVVRLIGKGIGMNEFDEFYNAFYLIPSNFPPDDTFLTFSMSKLDWSYAKAKGYAEWSKKMVGHWSARSCFVNSRKGEWSFSIFDLLTEPKVENIYYTLYSSLKDAEDQVEVWGSTGYRVDRWFVGLTEVNFAFDRFVSCVNNDDDLGLTDLIDRAHLIQFYEGGYSNMVAAVEDSTQTL